MYIIPNDSLPLPLDPVIPSTPTIRLIDGQWCYTSRSRLTRASIGLITPTNARERWIGAQYVSARLAGEILSQGFLALICYASVVFAERAREQVGRQVATADQAARARYEIYRAAGGPMGATVYNYTTKGKRDHARRTGLWWG